MDNDPMEHSDSFKFVSYNIHLANEIPAAVDEFQDFSELIEPAIVFLQEMDTTGVQELAKHLDMNYVFIPAVNYGDDLEFYGNGILSTSELLHVEKIILPHISKSGRQRIALYAKVNIGGQDVHLYNVHLEIITMSRKKRKEQLVHIVEHANELDQDAPIIIAGDFNSFFKKDREQFNEVMEESGLSWQTENIEFTSVSLHGIVKKPVDHIFTKGIVVDTIGAESNAMASDHYPIFAILRF